MYTPYWKTNSYQMAGRNHKTLGRTLYYFQMKRLDRNRTEQRVYDAIGKQRERTNKILFVIGNSKIVRKNSNKKLFAAIEASFRHYNDKS
jgi:hypothetical protein